MHTDLKAASPAPDRVSTATSSGWLSRAQCTGELSMTSDANMAWLLAIGADVCLTSHVRNMAIVELGCGEVNLAIKRIPHAVMSSAMTLPVAAFDRLSRWLDGHARYREEPRLRTMLAKIQVRQHRAPSGCAASIQGSSQRLRAGLASRDACFAGTRDPPTQTPAVLRRRQWAHVPYFAATHQRTVSRRQSNRADGERLRANPTGFAAAYSAVSPVRTAHLSHPPNQRYRRLETQLDGGEFRGSRICTPRRTHNGVYLSLLHE
jgi:hypothetical protein